MRCSRAALVATALAMILVSGLARAQEVEARLDRTRIALGETTNLRVVVRGSGDIRPPAFTLPDGLQQITSGRQQSFSWINGRASSETEFQFEILGEHEGSYSIGPILVTVESKSFRSGQLQLQVLASMPVGGGTSGAGGGDPAWLSAAVEPANPYVGQEVTLRVRLFQRLGFAEDPQYIPPATTGFWSDRPSAPESYYANDKGGRVLVTETRTRLYPLAIGEATIGEASALVVLESDDPMALLGGNRQRLLKSHEIPVRVRPLPNGAPSSFTGAVGRFDIRFTADRKRTSRDVPVTVRLDVRGRGNLPLVRAPVLAGADYEVFASTVEDSLGPPGNAGPGRKRFQWTLLPRHEGPLTVAPPEFSWFDPASESYRKAPGDGVTLEVGPALFNGAGTDGGFPRALQARPADPQARAAQPWAFALGGIALGLAIRWWRRGGRRPVDPTTTEAVALRDRLRSARGAEFWKLAEQAVIWLQSHGKVADSPEWREARSRVLSARYGGDPGDEASVRRGVIERMEAAVVRAPRRVPERVLAVLIAAAAIAFCVWLGPRPGDARAARGALAADGAARNGELELARRGWLELWNRGGHDARLAARIAWSHAQAGEIGPAALWVMRGQIADPRESALRWIEGRVREAGGLVGATPARVPVHPWEWALAALLAGAAAIVLWGRAMAPALLLLLATLVCAAVYPAQGWWAVRSGRAVVLERAVVGGSGVELDPGQMVRLLQRRGEQARIAAGRVTEGWVPARAIARVVPVGAGDG